jgi:hypothetical protein
MLAVSSLCGSLRSEGLHDYLSMPHNKRVGCELIVIVCSFSATDVVGIGTFKDRRRPFEKSIFSTA